MLTEYKIKLENDGLTITQRVEPGTSQPLPTFTASNALQASFQQSKSANAENKSPNATSPKPGGSSTGDPGPGGSTADDPGPGSGRFTGSGAAPITIIGPNIFICRPCSHLHQEEKEEKS
jgi:hypothetical protein